MGLQKELHLQNPVLSPKLVKAILVLLLLGLFAASFVITPYMVAATISYFCLCCGLLVRKNRILHARLMSMGMLIDVGIVLVLEVSRHAINTALAMTLSPLQQAHVGASTIAVILYIPVFILGRRRFQELTGRRAVEVSTAAARRKAHIRLGLTAFAFRTLGFVLMFSLLWKIKAS